MWPSHSAYDMHTTENWCSTWLACITFFLHIIVSLRRALPIRIAFILHIMVSGLREWLSPLSCTIWWSIIRRGLPISPLAYTEVTDVRHGLQILTTYYTYRSSKVVCGLTTLFVACTQESVDVQHFFTPSFVACKNWSADIGYDMSASSLAYTHRSTYISQRHAASAKKCMHLSWNVCIWKMTSTHGMWLHLRLAHIIEECVYH